MSYYDDYGDNYNDLSHWENYWEQREYEEEEEEFESMMRIMLRTSTLKEDFMAYFWQPTRLNKMLEDGGWERAELYFKN